MKKNLSISEFVLLPIHDKDGNIIQDVKLGVKEQFTLRAKEHVFDNDWAKLVYDIQLKGESDFRSMKVVNNLRTVEEKYNCDLVKILNEWT